MRLIVKADKTSPTVTVLGSVHHSEDLQAAPGKEGVDDVLGELFSYGTQTLDRLAFQKALDDIAANEAAGFEFSLRVVKQEFSRGVQLLADNELHPALPGEAFDILKQQTAQYVAGNLKSPGYRTSRAVSEGLLPKDDPSLRHATPASISSLSLDDIKQYYAKTFRPDLTTIVVIGDVTPEDAKNVIEKWFAGDWKATGPKPDVFAYLLPYYFCGRYPGKPLRLAVPQRHPEMLVEHKKPIRYAFKDTGDLFRVMTQLHFGTLLILLDLLYFGYIPV